MQLEEWPKLIGLCSKIWWNKLKYWASQLTLIYIMVYLLDKPIEVGRMKRVKAVKTRQRIARLGNELALDRDAIELSAQV